MVFKAIVGPTKTTNEDEADGAPRRKFWQITEIPCAKPAIYVGCIFGGIISAVMLTRTKDLNSLHYGVCTFFSITICSL